MDSILKKTTDMCIITTYRCPMHCQMCNIWKNPSDQTREIKAEELKILPKVKFVNVTGGEPFMRNDLDEIVSVLFTKASRVVISTSGWFADQVISLAKQFPKIGIRISLEGLSQKNDQLRGQPGGFDKGLKTLLTLKDMGVKDIGFGCTVSNHNSADMLSLYQLAKNLGMEFATAAFHNSYYFHKYDNFITNKQTVVKHFEKLVAYQLKEKSPKSWMRAFFNYGLVNYIEGKPRLMPCEAGSVNFFVDPYGEVFPCNGMEETNWMESMGNIRKVKHFDEIWHSQQAQKVRNCVKHCTKNCWMVGTVAPVMKKYPRQPLQWVVKNKVKSFLHQPLQLSNDHTDDGQIYG